MEIIYDNHREEWDECINNNERKKIAETWLKKETLDNWRHERMLNGINALINGKNNWLTVGDGRYGTDANYILRQGDQAHASDISDKLLKIGNELGFINNFSEENAEKLSFKDESFDYVLIKEAFHHCPRPWMALYEAFRVCKKGVVLIEPNDSSAKRSIRKSIINSLKTILKILLRKEIYKSGYNFETVGNFVYSTNQRELEKFLLGMHYRNFAVKKISDFYLDGGEFINIDSKKLTDRIKIKLVKSLIFIQEILSDLGFIENTILCSILFKEEPNEKTLNELKNFNWDFIKLPKNPYI